MTTTTNWFHAHQDSVKRSEGKSAVGLVAYITGETLKDDRTGTWCSRNHPGEVIAWGTIAPSPAPAYLTDNSQLGKAWNAVESSETRKNSLVAVHWNVAASREFTDEDHKLGAREIAEAFSHRYGVMVTYGVHKPTEHGDDRNWHYHFGHNMRRVGPDGFGEKAREIIDQKPFVQETIAGRAMIAGILNQHLARIGSTERVSHLSFVDQGIAKEATKHLGNKQNQAELKGIATETGNENRDIRERNARYDEEQKTRTLEAQQLRHEAQIIDLTTERLRRRGARKMEFEFTNQQSVDRENDEKQRLNILGQQKRNIERSFDDVEEKRKRFQVNAASLETTESKRRDQGDIADANFRWQDAVNNKFKRHSSHPEETLADAVGSEATEFRKEQDKLREQERATIDPEKRKLIELRRHIEACDFMALGSDRCAGISAVIIGREDNDVSNRDRERAGEWRSVGKQLRAEREDLRDAMEERMMDLGVWSRDEVVRVDLKR
jgi:hypothetical protein